MWCCASEPPRAGCAPALLVGCPSWAGPGVPAPHTSLRSGANMPTVVVSVVCGGICGHAAGTGPGALRRLQAQRVFL